MEYLPINPRSKVHKKQKNVALEQKILMNIAGKCYGRLLKTERTDLLSLITQFFDTRTRDLTNEEIKYMIMCKNSSKFLSLLQKEKSMTRFKKSEHAHSFPCQFELLPMLSSKCSVEIDKNILEKLIYISDEVAPLKIKDKKNSINQDKPTILLQTRSSVKKFLSRYNTKKELKSDSHPPLIQEKQSSQSSLNLKNKAKNNFKNVIFYLPSIILTSFWIENEECNLNKELVDNLAYLPMETMEISLEHVLKYIHPVIDKHAKGSNFPILNHFNDMQTKVENNTSFTLPYLITIPIQHQSYSERKTSSNSTFSLFYPWITVTLSRLKKVENQLISCSKKMMLDANVVAHSILYLEKLTYLTYVNKSNAYIISACCFLISLKLHGDIPHYDLPIYTQQIENLLKVDIDDVLTMEIPIIVALEFNLFPKWNELEHFYLNVLEDLKIVE